MISFFALSILMFLLLLSLKGIFLTAVDFLLLIVMEALYLQKLLKGKHIAWSDFALNKTNLHFGNVFACTREPEGAKSECEAC